MAAIIEEKIIMPQSPLQIVKERYGSKEALVAKVAELVEPQPGESTDAHKRRLRNVANRKLLALVELGEKVKSFGGRDALVGKVLTLKSQSKDNEYSDKLKTVALGRLVDMAGSLQRRSDGKTKKKPKHLRQR